MKALIAIAIAVSLPGGCASVSTKYRVNGVEIPHDESIGLETIVVLGVAAAAVAVVASNKSNQKPTATPQSACAEGILPPNDPRCQAQ